ncbi:MAG TPA: lactonase family protein [Devosia sp.]|nr:lactonase family protein [Devosia sp.]
MAGTLLFIGSQTRNNAAGTPGITVFNFDDATGALGKVAEVGGIDNANWLALDRVHDRLYAVTEVGEWNEGTVSAYDLDPATGRLSYINKQPTLGGTTCHAGLSPDGAWLAVANYAVLPASERPDQSVALYRADGMELAPASGRARHHGTGPNPDRQERPHGHCVLFLPDGRNLLVADLGLDRLVAYGVGSKGELVPTPDRDVVFSPGRGPRHATFHPAGDVIYVVHELTAGVSVLDFDGTRARLRNTVDIAYPQPVSPAAIVVSPDGRHLYVTVRFTGDIVGFVIGADRGLTEIGRWPCGGTTPRDARLSPSGHYLLVANQDNGTLAVFRRDTETGALQPTGSVSVATPMCVAF